MASTTFSILFIFLMTLFPTRLLSNTLKPSLNSHKSQSKRPVSFSTRIYNRRHHINYKTNNNSTFSDSSKVQMRIQSSTHSVLVMEVGIGTNHTFAPMLTTELMIDTGSTFNWLQAQPCEPCYNQGDFPLYNRTTSISYRSVHCEDELCTKAPEEVHPGCSSLTLSPTTACSYNVGYLDGANSTGVIGTETFYFFDVWSNMYMEKEYVLFGLGTSNYIGDQMAFTPGVAGFGMGYGTFLSAFEVKKFSHCFPREEDEDDSGVLSLGEEANLVGEKVELLKIGLSSYSAQLTNVYVSGEPIILEDNGTLPAIMIFDTGSSETYLDPHLMDGIEAAIKQIFRKFRAKWSPTNQLCYKITDMLSVNLDLIANVTFEFRYNTKVDLVSYHSWEQYTMGSQLMSCLRLRRDSHHGLSVFGNNAMRNMNIGYSLYEDDLAMYFNHQPCWM